MCAMQSRTAGALKRLEHLEQAARPPIRQTMEECAKLAKAQESKERAALAVSRGGPVTYGHFVQREVIGLEQEQPILEAYVTNLGNTMRGGACQHALEIPHYQRGSTGGAETDRH